nr:Uma2 family endonuclease [Gloeothece verrucosa]
MIQTAKPALSLEEFLKLPETQPESEYLDGKIIQKPMPQGKHSRIQGKLVTTINAIAETERIALALPELRCSFGGQSIVPDVAVLKWENIPKDDNGDIANVVATSPDWIIEILSPEQNQSRVTNKILHCLNCGCKLGWLIDPQVHSLLIFPPQQQPLFFEEEDRQLPVPDFLTQLNLKVKDIFSWLKL